MGELFQVTAFFFVVWSIVFSIGFIHAKYKNGGRQR